VIVKDVSVSLSKSYITAEVDFGNSFTITCVAEGGRVPHYLQLSHQKTGATSFNELILYDTDNSKTPDTVVVGDNTITITYSVTTTGHEDNGQYRCIAKNRVAANAEKELSAVGDVIVGM